MMILTLLIDSSQLYYLFKGGFFIFILRLVYDVHIFFKSETRISKFETNHQKFRD